MNQDVMETKIFSAAVRQMPTCLHKHLPTDLTILFKQPEGLYFQPTNQYEQVFTICKNFADHHVIVQQKVPIWKDGHFSGIAYFFMYRKDMKFSLNSEEMRNPMVCNKIEELCDDAQPFFDMMPNNVCKSAFKELFKQIKDLAS